MARELKQIQDTGNFIEGLFSIFGKTLEISGWRDLSMGRRYPFEVMLVTVVWVVSFLGLLAAPILFFSHPIFVLMQVTLAAGGILRFGLRWKWVQRRVPFTVPIPPHTYFWGDSWSQGLAAKLVPLARVRYDEDKDENVGMMPVTWQLFVEGPATLLLAFIITPFDWWAGSWLAAGGLGIMVMSRRRRSYLLDHELDIGDQLAEQESEEEILETVQRRRERERNAGAGGYGMAGMPDDDELRRTG